MKPVTLEVPDRLADLLASEAMKARAVEVLSQHFEAELPAQAPPALVFSAGTTEVEAPAEADTPRGFDPDAVRRRMLALLGPASTE